MPIREWHERITIDCSDHELPRAIAALTGSYEGDTHNVYLHYDSQTSLSLPHYQPFSSNGVRQRDVQYG